MNKKKFIDNLNKKLDILSSEERIDIINEYSDIIDEKIKNGKTETEAINEFGDIDVLVEEILSTYKINSKYTTKINEQKKSNKDDIVNGIEGFIKDLASKLSDFTKNVVNDFNDSGKKLTVELVFEILIKVIILLVICAILRLPFYIINGLGRTILDFAIYPIDRILYAGWYILTGIIYLVVCVLIGIIMFKDYFSNDKKTTEKKDINKCDNNDSVDLEKNSIKENKKKEVNKNKNVSLIGEILLIILKIFIIIVFIPLIFFNIGIFISIIIYVYMMFKGLKIYSALIVLIGLFIGFNSIQTIVFKGIFNKKKIHIYPVIIGIIVTIVGGLLVFDDVLDFKYYNSVPNDLLSQKEIIFEENISKKTELCFYDDNYVVNIDDSIPDNSIIIKVKYYDEYVGIDGIRNENDCLNVIYNYNKLEIFKNIMNLVIKQLNSKKIYSIDFSKVEVEITGNTNTLNNLDY